MKAKIKKLELTILERVMIGTLLPSQGSKLEQIVVRDLMAKFEFTDEEKMKFEINAKREVITWNQEATKEIFPIELTNVEVDILKVSSKLLDEKKQVNQQNLSLIEKIDSL